MMQAIHDSSAVHRRPSRWAWKLDGSEISRAQLVRTWQFMKDRAHILEEGRVWYCDGRGCHTSTRSNGKEWREIFTLRDLLKMAHRDYKPLHS